jgi:hypothetical protein
MTNLALTDRDGRPPPTNRGADRRHELFELEERPDDEERDHGKRKQRRA